MAPDDLAARRAHFARLYGREPELAVRAPGRVNLIGEHTDYSGGLVLPCAIDRDTVVLGALRDDARVRIHSREASPGAEPSELSLAEPPKRAGDWLDYVRGAYQGLAEETGRKPPGLDLSVASTVPAESGLSSSAAFGVALVLMLERALDIALAPADRARLAHRSEREFVGVPCGIMDQYASALSRRDHALRLDCRSREVRYVPLPGERVRLLVAHSGVRRRLAGGSYGDRAAECEAALAAARGVLTAAGRAAPETLRDVEAGDLDRLRPALEPTLFRRLHHVVTENARVDAFCAALEAGDLAAAGALLEAGHASLRDDFEVSIPELDALCEIASGLAGVHGSRLTGAGFGGCTVHLVDAALTQSAAAVHGSRLTGAGFGGCTVHLVDAALTQSAAAALADGFAARFGRRPPVFEVRPSDGASTLESF